MYAYLSYMKFICIVYLLYASICIYIYLYVCYFFCFQGGALETSWASLQGWSKQCILCRFGWWILNKFSLWGIWTQLCFRLLCHMRYAGHHHHRVLYRWQAWSFFNLKKLFRTLHLPINWIHDLVLELFGEEWSYFWLSCQHVTTSRIHLSTRRGQDMMGEGEVSLSSARILPRLFDIAGFTLVAFPDAGWKFGYALHIISFCICLVA